MILLIHCRWARTQDPVYTERIDVHPDRNLYLSGEMIWYALYCLEGSNNAPSRISSVASIELLNGESEAVLQQRVRLRDGAGSGCMQVPAGLPGGTYTLRAYTAWQRNLGPAAYDYQRVLILHPSMPFPMAEIAGHAGAGSSGMTGDPEPSPGLTGPGNTPRAKAEGLRESYRPGEPISLAFSLLSPRGDPVTGTFSVSVCMSGAFAGGSRSCESYPQGSAPLHLPEPVGPVVSGTVTDGATRHPVAGQLMLLSFVDTITNLYTTVTGQDGRFHFLLDEITGEREMVIQPADTLRKLLVDVDQQFAGDPLPPLTWQPIEPGRLEEICRRLFATVQINEAYGLSHYRAEEEKAGILRVVDRYDHRIILEDYIRLPLMEEVFRELGKRVFLSRGEHGYDLFLLDLETNRVIGPRPCFLMDGVPFFDPAEVLSLDPSALKEIRLKSSMYFAGDLRMDGIIELHSSRGDASDLRMPGPAIRTGFTGFPTRRSYLRQDSAVLVSRNLPLHMNTLLFEPSLRVGPCRPCRVSFMAPDGRGSYEIILRGFGEGGCAVEEHFTFDVR